MSFSPQLFLSNVKAKDGLARPNRFETIVPIPKYVGDFVGNSILEQIANLPNVLFTDVQTGINNLLGNKKGDPQSISANPTMSRYLTLQCETAEIPGKTLLTAEAKVYGPTYKVPYQTQYNDMSMTFLCTNEFYERKLFERWIEAIMPLDSSNLRFPKGENSRYLTNIQIIQYDDFIKKIHIVELRDAFPIGIAPQQLSWADDGFHRLNVQFAYHKYETIYSGQYDLGLAAAALFGTRAASWFDKTTTELGTGVTNTLLKIF
jgi:hypothetical protein